MNGDKMICSRPVTRWNTGSRLIFEVKQGKVWLVISLVTECSARVSRGSSSSSLVRQKPDVCPISWMLHMKIPFWLSSRSCGGSGFIQSEWMFSVMPGPQRNTTFEGSWSSEIWSQLKFMMMIKCIANHSSRPSVSIRISLEMNAHTLN